MARTKTTHDAFSAIAEPKRRALIERLVTHEQSVNQLVEQMGWSQPMVSKHLAVLKQVGLVSEKKVGQQRLYHVEAIKLKPIQEWATQFERYWEYSLDHLGEYLDKIQNKDDDQTSITHHNKLKEDDNE